MQKITYLLAVLTFIEISCQDKNTCTLTGTFTNCKEATILYLSEYETRNIIDSFIVKNGAFSHKIKLAQPKKFLLHNINNRNDFRDRKIIWLEPSTISLSGNFEFLKNLQVKGSVCQLLFDSYNFMLESSNREIGKLKDRILYNSDVDRVAVTNKIDSLKNKLSAEIVALLIANKNPYFTLNELYTESYLAQRHLNKEQVSNVYYNLPVEFRDSEVGNEIMKYLTLPEPPKIGEMAKEIIQLTPSGDTIKLSDFKGKFVLLDFWASYCGPCREEFKWLRKFYKKYHPIGLEILGISGDYDKKKWLDAIEQDSIPWINISDLKGWKNEAFLLYDIKFVPQKFLINPDGLIIKDEKNIDQTIIDTKGIREILDRK